MTSTSPLSMEVSLVALGWTGQQARAGVKAGLAPYAPYWTSVLDLSPEECLSWWAVTGADSANPHPRTVPQWVEAGVRRPQDRPAGMSVSAVYLCRVAGVPADPGWGEREWTGRARTPGSWVCPHLMRAAVDLGRAPVVAGALVDAAREWWFPSGSQECFHEVPPVEGLTTEQRPLECGWFRCQSGIGRKFLMSLAGLDWADVTMCLRAGMHTQAAVGHVRSGADMDPVRLLAALTG